MVEILGAVWLTALILSIPVTFFNIRSVRRSSKSSRLEILNLNLAKIGMTWSLSSENFHPIGETSVEADVKKMTRNYIIMAALGLFGALGFFFLLIVSLSMRLMVTRKAKLVFSTVLVENRSLDVTTIRELVETIQHSH